jgi:sulfur dioxygenase
MLFRQILHRESSTYTYLVAAEPGAGAVLVDPVKDHTPLLLQLLRELGLRLRYALDTHVHADHVTALGDLRDATGCITVMGEPSGAVCVSRKVVDGEIIEVDGLRIEALATPGHTADSFCYRADDRVFTGDTLLIRSTGRTDFQNGDARTQYRSLWGKLMTLPDETLVYPGHDYRGLTASTIGEERAHNPRLQIRSEDDYVRLMAALRLPDPQLMDVAVPANLSCGKLPA